MRNILILNKWSWVLINLLLFLPVCYSQEFEPSQTVYISSTEGDDTYEGSILYPKKTINGLSEELRKNCRILLKRDDVFYENLSNFDSCVISSYGTGKFPLICGFRKLESNTFWEKESENIWKIDMYRPDAFSGYPLPADQSFRQCHNIGFIYDETNKKLHGRLVEKRSLLENKWDLFTSENNKTNQEFRFIYIFHEDPRAEYATFCFPVYECGITFLQNCHISNITVQGFSLNGIDDLYNCIVENCAIDLIGGCIRLDDSEKWERQGNGIECWINGEYDSANYNLVTHCWVSRTYGSGVAIQGKNATTNATSNRFRENVFYYCRHALENSLQGSEYIDCEFVGNICYKMGENGFDSPEERDANLFSQETSLHKDKIKVYNNFFWGSNHAFLNNKFLALDIKFNVIFIYEKQFLNNFYNDYKPFQAQAFLETNQYHKFLSNKDYICIMDPEESPSKPIPQYRAFMERFFPHVDIRNLPDFKELNQSMTMLRYIAGQREF